MFSLAPIVLFTYNRPFHTEKAVESLKRNDLARLSDLVVFSDGPKNDDDAASVFKVREQVKRANGFKSVKIVENERNQGLATSVINGVTKVLAQYGKAIVMEDDLVTSPKFIAYMNNALDFYEKHDRIGSITGYNHPPETMKIPGHYDADIYFCARHASWGWATWHSKWRGVDWEMKDYGQLVNDRRFKIQYEETGKDKLAMLAKQKEGLSDSWAIRWDLSNFLKDRLCVYPVKSFVNNIGTDGTGTHYTKTIKDFPMNDLSLAKYPVEFKDHITIDPMLIRNFKKAYKISKRSRLRKFLEHFKIN